MEILPVRRGSRAVEISICFSSLTQTLQHLQRNRCLAPVSWCWIMNLNSTTLGQCWLPNACICLRKVVKILQSCDGVRQVSRLKLFFLYGKWIGVCSLLTPKQKLGSQPMIGEGSARGPDGPSQSGVAHGLCLIPVSVAGEGVQVGGGVEQKEERLGIPRSDMACG